MLDSYIVMVIVIYLVNRTRIL